MKKAALVVIYNHQFNQNIPTIESIYKSRFSTIFHLMPFYSGPKRNVIAVYENSRYFQGYVAQAWRELGQSDSDDFIFVADDLLLNPLVNESNYRRYLGVDDHTSFIPSLTELHKLKSFWWRCHDAIKWNPGINGVEVTKLLPAPDQAISLLVRHGIEVEPIPAFLAFNNLSPTDEIGKKTVNMRYPLIGSYSDIFAIPRSVMDSFVTFCGIFAALELFVELAVPSALAMASSKISTESTLALHGRALWTPSDMEILNPFKGSITELLKNFPEHLYIHPIKLSKWIRE